MPDTGRLIAFSIKASGVHPGGGEAGGGSVAAFLKADGDEATIRVYSRSKESCSLSLSAGVDSAPVVPAPALLWTFHARLVSHDDDGAGIDLTWRREGEGAAVGFPAIGDRKRRLYLFDGQPIPIEYALLDQSASPECDGYQITAAMFFPDSPETADARLAYDLWMIYTDARGIETTQRIENQAGQSRAAEYGFSPLWFDGAGQLDSAGPIGLAVSGSVRGRLLADGNVHMNIGALRMVRDRMGSGTAQAGGKSTNIALGETVEVQLPPVSASLSPYGLIDPLFAGARIAIRVTPRRIS